MNIGDIEELLNRVGGILASKATPDVVIANRPTTILPEIARNYTIDICSIQILYNEFKGRSSNVGIIMLDHIAAALATNEDEFLEISSIIQQSPTLKEQYRESNARNFLGKEIKIYGTPLQSVHMYVLNMMNKGRNLRDIYESLKGMITVSGKSLSLPAILGGIAYADYQGGASRIGTDQLFSRILSFESPDSPLRISSVIYRDSIEWYSSQINPTISNANFYDTVLQQLNLLPTSEMSLYPPSVKTEWLSIRPLEHLDITDLLMKGYTSDEMPAIMVNNNSQTIFKTLDNHRKNLSWFQSVKPFTLKSIVRISKNPERYLPIEYLSTKNWFTFKRKDKYLSTIEISNILCKQLGIQSLTAPIVTSTTYQFITNYIASGNNFGINKNIMAWLVMNPPEEYRNTRIQDYVFMKEDTKPNMLKKLLNIHIQLGTEKMYLSISRQKTTDGTVVQTNDGLVGFVGEQSYLAVKINKCPTRAHAMICQQIYAHLITMYLKYHRYAADEIFRYTGHLIPKQNPVIVPLQEEELTLHRIFKNEDPIMYKYISTERAEALPVPIKRGEVEEYRKQGYGVMKLPTIVINNPSITFETLGVLWVRTHSKGQTWVLRLKDQGGYIPMAKQFAPTSSIPVKVNTDWTLEELYTKVSCNDRPFRATKLMDGEVGRFAEVSNSVISFLKPLIGTKSILRHYISANILYALNKALLKKISVLQLAQYAYLCKQECWNQSIEEIEEDILFQRIYPMKHIRAIEAAFQVNIYMIMDDAVEPYLRKPNHYSFHLHKPANKILPTIILHSMKEEPQIFTLIMKQSLRNQRIEPESYLLPTTDYLDQKFSDVNNIRMYNPIRMISDILKPTSVLQNMYGWNAVSQVIDSYGKVRAINYQKNSQLVTIVIGFSYVLDMPIGIINKPSEQFLQDVPLQERESISKLILSPIPDSDFEKWRQMERDSRILRIVCHMLYSISGYDLESFMDKFDIVNTTYNTSRLPHAIPQFGSDIESAWQYFASVIDGMIVKSEDDYRIQIPSYKTLEAMRLYLHAQDKIKWPLTFPFLIKYRWDVPSRIGESVYLSETDLLQQIVVDRVPAENSQFLITTIPYVLSRNNFKYLVQMVRDQGHASYIIQRWNEEQINYGFNAEGSLPYNDISYVDPSIAVELKQASITNWGDRWFVLFPI